MIRSPKPRLSTVKEGMDHAFATMSGKKPKKAFVVERPMPSRKSMLWWLKRWKNDGPAPKFVASNGTWFEGRADVDDYPIAVKWRTNHRPRAGNCFQNAREFCLANPKSRYFEGFYLLFESPQDHAWVVMPDGRVLDFTHEAVIRKLLRAKDRVYVTKPLYLGVEVPHDALSGFHAAVKRNKPILGLYQASRKRRPK